jgi:glycosyltransferase involved in cell wall biosynthesis
MSQKIIRITTVPISLKTLLKGQHRFMKENGFEVIGVSSKGKELEDVKNEEGIQVIELQMTRTISPFKDLVSLWKFYWLCKKEKPTIVHSHTPKAGIIGMLGAKFARVPNRLHTVAGMPLMEASGVKRKVLNFVEKLTYAAATKVYPNSKGLYDFIVANNFTPTSKLKVIGNGSSNGINTSYFNRREVSNEIILSLKEQLKIEDGDFVFVFVGRLVSDKGINELIESFANICSISNYKSSKLILVGSFENELDPLSRDTIKEIEENSKIFHVGFQQDVRPYLAVSDCLVFPSYREGFPNVVMQAGAMEIPSIVSDINGCNEIIIENINGLIIQPKETESLTIAMRKMIDNPDTFQKLKENSRKFIVDRYEQITIWNALLSEYKGLFKQNQN